MKTPSLDLLRVLITVAEFAKLPRGRRDLADLQPGVSFKKSRSSRRSNPCPSFSLEGKRKVLTHYGRSLYELAKEGATTLERRIENLHRVYASVDLLTVRIRRTH